MAAFIPSAVTRIAATLVFAVMALAGLAAPSHADGVQPPASYPERVLGNPDAPVTIYEYSSLTCPHCATFHNDTLPELEKAYIETGKVKVVFRDFPLDGTAFGAAMIGRCAPEPMYFKLIALMFENQSTWTRSDDPMSHLKQYARLAGMDDASIDSCLKNEDLFQSMRDVQVQAKQRLGISSTPSFVVGGEMIPGGIPYEAFAERIDALLSK